MKKADTATEIPAKRSFEAIKKLNAITKPTIEIIKHIYLPPKVHEQTFWPPLKYSHH